MIDPLNRIVLWFLGLLTLVLGGLFSLGCQGAPKYFGPAETRAGWSPLGGVYFSDTKDNKVTIDVERDAESGEITKFHVDIDNRASDVNKIIPEVMDAYARQQVHFNDILLTHGENANKIIATLMEMKGITTITGQGFDAMKSILRVRLPDGTLIGDHVPDSALKGGVMTDVTPSKTN